MCAIMNLLFFHHQLMMSIIEQFQKLQESVRHLEAQAQRAPNSVAILAVSKGQPVETIKALYDAGQHSFGENYADEALAKISALAQKQIAWHFIGRIQSRKCALIAEHFDWVHSLCRLKEAERLNASRPTSKPPLNVCIQVNLEDSERKNGLTADALPEFCRAIQGFKSLKLRGLMIFPDQQPSEQAQRALFKKARALFETQQDLPHWDTLSMGMSQDYEAAIKEGTTLIRIGRQLFQPDKV